MLPDWHKRYHPLLRQWVVYAAHRNRRPWSFDPAAAPAPKPAYDPTCYLCPGNTRVGGARNPAYAGLHVFDNDHPVVGAAAPAVHLEHPLYRASRAGGYARVLCYHPRHDLTMASIPRASVRAAWRELRAQTRAALADEAVHSLLIFENKGELVGTSNPHPHCQLYALDFPVGLVTHHLAALAEHRARRGTNLFADVLASETSADAPRVVAENEYCVAFVPFFARFAYEVMVMPRRRHPTLATLSDAEVDGLADVYQEVNRRYDLNYRQSFPYVMSVLQSPLDGGEYPDYHAHVLLQPPLRQPGLQKFLAGPETGADTFMADTLPEEKAAELRAVDLADYDPDNPPR